MPDGGRKVTVVVDIVQSGDGAAKVKSALKPVEAEVKRINRETELHHKKTDAAILASKRAVVDQQVREVRRLNREQKRAADDFLRHLRQVNAEEKKVRSMTGSVFAGSFLGTAAASAFSRITSEATQAASAVFEFSSRMQQSQVAFSTLMGNSAAAAQHIKELKDLTMQFPLDFEPIANMSMRLQGAGVEARRIIPLIKDIGNVAAATGPLTASRLEGIGTALSQIQSKSKVSAEEMEQLAERGVPAWRILSESIGKTQQETRKMAEDGEISADQLFDAFQKFSRARFGDAMQRQVRTFGGAMQQIKNVVLVTASTAFAPFFDKISTLAAKTAAEVQRQKGDFSKVGTTVGKAIGEGIGVAIGTAIRAAFIDIIVKPMWVPQDSVFWSSVLGLGKGTYQGIASNFTAQTPLPGQYTTNYARPTPQTTNPAGAPGNDAAASSGTSSRRDIATILNDLRSATMMQESGGNARARNTRTDASGLFQVMPANIGPWTKQVFGRAMSQNDFLSSPKAQEAVFNHVMGQYLETAMRLAGGNEDVAIRMAAAAWYGGPGAMKRYDDPRRFRANEPSFREYTTSVLGKVKRGGKDITFGDVAEDLQDSARRRSEESTAQARREFADMAVQLLMRAGLLPGKEAVDAIKDRFTEAATSQGVRQPSDASVTRWIDAWIDVVRQRRGPVEMNDVPMMSVGIQNRPLEENPHIERIHEIWADHWKTQREEQQRFFQEAAEGWEDVLNDLVRGDFKSFWQRIKQEMLNQFIRPAAQMLAGLLGTAPGQNAYGNYGQQQGGFNLGSLLGGLFGSGGGIFGGSGTRPGGTPNFNPSASIGGIMNQQGSGSPMSGSMWGGWQSAKDLGGFLSQNLPGGSGILGNLKGNLKGILGKGGIFGSKGFGFNAGTGAGLGMLAMLAGSAVGGRWGGVLSGAGMGAQIGSLAGPWGSLIGAGIGAMFGGLFGGGDDSIKKLREAAASEFGISVKDKNVLKQLKQIGEGYFGKGKVGENARAVVRTDEGMNILRAYAESSGQSGLKIDRLFMGDENWSGNQFRSKFGGFRALGGPVQAGVSYVVGERRPELFTPTVSGHISPTVGGMNDPQLKVIMGQIEETMHTLATRLHGLRPGDVVSMGADENPAAFRKAVETEYRSDLRASERTLRSIGTY